MSAFLTPPPKLYCRQPSRSDIILTGAVPGTLSPDLVQKPDEFRQEGDAGYEDVISRILAYLTDADNYVTEEEREEILAALAEAEAGNYYTSEEVDAMLQAKNE